MLDRIPLRRGSVRAKHWDDHRHRGRFRRRGSRQCSGSGYQQKYKSDLQNRLLPTRAITRWRRLPPGTYDVSINAPGFYPNNRQNVSVGETAPLRLDVRLLEYQLGTLGDGREFRVQLTSPHAAPSGPTPRTADGKPDLSGVWFAQRTLDAGKPEPLPWAASVAPRTSREQLQGCSRSALPAARHHQRGGFISLQAGSNAHPAGDALRG